MGRGRCGRGCDIGAAFNSPTGLIYPAKDTGRCDVRTDSIVAEVLLDEATNRATGVRVIDRNTKQQHEFTAKTVVLAASTLESTRLLLNSRSRAYPEWTGQLLWRPGPLFLRAHHGTWCFWDAHEPVWR